MFTESEAEEIRSKERWRIGARIRQMEILRLQVGVDPLEEVNDILARLADDVDNNWSDYDDC